MPSSQPSWPTLMLTKLSSDFTKFVNQSTLRFHYSELRHIQVMDNSPVNGGSMSGLDRIPTHIEGLDENMQGGIPQGHICLVAGASGANEIEFDIFNVV